MKFKILITFVILILLMLNSVLAQTNDSLIDGTKTNITVVESINDDAKVKDNIEVTRDDALNAIRFAEVEMRSMIKDNISVNSIRDILILANQSLQRADFAQIILNDSRSAIAKQARAALKGLDYEGFSYADVLTYTNKVSLKKQQAYELIDNMVLAEVALNEYKNIGINISEAEELLELATKAFEKERYNEANLYLRDFDSFLESKRSEITALNIVLDMSTNFIVKFWKQIAIIFVVFMLISLLLWRRISIIRIKNNLSKILIEHEALLQLMEQNQIDRFKEGSISKIIYEIRASKYIEKINKIKQIVPVLEKNLRKKGYKLKEKIVLRKHGDGKGIIDFKYNKQDKVNLEKVPVPKTGFAQNIKFKVFKNLIRKKEESEIPYPNINKSKLVEKTKELFTDELKEEKKFMNKNFKEFKKITRKESKY